jgi:hypothetical protein
MSAPPVRDRAAWVALALIAVSVLILHREVIFAGRVYHMDDAADGYYPCHVAISRAYREGELPVWERGAAAGWPMVADPYYGTFYPGGLLFGIFGAARGLGLSIVVHTILCAAGMLMLLRRRGLSLSSAVFGAASLALSSFLVCRIRHIIFPEGLAWLTIALAGIEGYLQTRSRRDLALAGASVGLMLLCGALPLMPFFGLFGLAYVVPRLLRSAAPIQAARWLSVAAGVGLLVACAQLIPTLAHLPLSPRALGTSPEFASSYAWPKLEYLATLVVPDLFGVDDRARWFGAFNHWEMAGYYVGLWAVLFAPLAFLHRRAGLRLEAAALWAIALVGIGLAFGDAGPLHGWFYKHVPLYAALRCPTRALVMTMLAFSILSAEGLETLIDRIGTATRPARWLAAAAACFAIGVALAWALPSTRLLFFGKGTIPAGIVEARRAFSHLAWVLGLGGAVLCLVRAGGVQALLAPMFAMLAVADLVSVDRGYVQPQPFDYVEGTDRFQAIDWLIAQRPVDRFALDAHGPFRLHNVGMTYGLEGAPAYSSVQTLKYVDFLEVLATGKGLPSPLRNDPAASDVRRYDSPLVDLLNVRWVIADRPPAPGWPARFHPGPSKQPASKYEPGWDRRLSVWENPHPMSRAFIVHAARVVRGESAEQAELAQLDPRRWAMVDRPTEVALPDSSDLLAEAAISYTATRTSVTVETNSPLPGVLVVADAHYPGWSVTVDGKPATLLRADYAFRGVALAAGRHQVVMRYVARPVRVGLGLSVLGILGLLLIGLTRKPDEAVLT